MQPSFYYWKTTFNLSTKESQTLQQLSVKNLYVKAFDVDWNDEKQSAEPIAKVDFQQAPPAGVVVTPVVFLTQVPLQKLDTAGLQALAKNINGLLTSIAAVNRLPLSTEVQLDCDWTSSTKTAYFYLLNALKQQPFFQQKILSATIRLHQLKFISRNGVPPADKGLLMCYNMGNLRSAKTANSILDENELKKYINHLSDYPLPLDVALPIFDWYVLFEGDRYKGLVREFAPTGKWAQQERIYLNSDTVVNGYAFTRGQWLRHEGSNAAVVERCAALVGKKLKATEVRVILYHLNEQDLTKYSPHELESFYNRLR